MPRIPCDCCGREIAAGMVAGRPSKGRVWRHDPPGRSSVHGDALVSCPGSLRIVELPTSTRQLELTDTVEDAHPDGIDTLPLF